MILCLCLMMRMSPNQTPAATSTPVQTLAEDKVVSLLESPLEKKPCFKESIMECLLKAASAAHLEPDYSDAELVGYTWPLLVNVIPWIKYEAQNMSEPSLRQELQCIREVNHLRYIIALIMCGFIGGGKNKDGGHHFPHVASKSGL